MLLSVGEELVRELSELRFTLGVEGGFDPNRCFKNGDIFARRKFITHHLGGDGAHEPFSIRPIVLLRYPLSVRPSMKCFINGKISEL